MVCACTGNKLGTVFGSLIILYGMKISGISGTSVHSNSKDLGKSNRSDLSVSGAWGLAVRFVSWH